MVAFHGSNVVVTGGTGALGSAVVAALRAAGAVCHVTNMVAAELEHYPHRNDTGVHVTTGLDLADEAAVPRFYGALPPLWGSIHLAGGFAMSPVAETSAVDFADQFQMNALSVACVFGGALRAIRAAPSRVQAAPGRPHRQRRGASGLEPGSARDDLLRHFYEAADVAAADHRARPRAGRGSGVNAVAPSILDTPASRAAGRPDTWVAPRRDRRGHRLSRLARQAG